MQSNLSPDKNSRDPLRSELQPILKEPNLNNKPTFHEIELNDISPQIEEKIDVNFKDNIKDILFIFVNPLSGNREGKIFLDTADKNRVDSKDLSRVIDYLSIKVNKNDERYKNPIIAYFFKWIDKAEFKFGVGVLKEYIKWLPDSNMRLKVLVAGGDGTVLSIIEGLKKEGVDITHCIFGHIPLGTGNDLSNALGFSNSVDIDENDLYSLYKILNRYREAYEGKVDVWSLDLELDKDKGEVIYIKHQEKVIMKTEQKDIWRSYKRTFINYWSLGYDARVGFNFDKNRTNSRCCNKCVYFWEGLKKNCCRGTVSVPQFLDSFNVIEDNPNETVNERTFFSNSNERTEDKIKIKYCFRPQSSLKRIGDLEAEKVQHLELKGSPVSLICQNINFYMAGAKDIWNKSGHNYAVQVVDTTKQEKYQQKLATMMNDQQRFNDHKLEFFSYSSGFITGMEKVIGGQADKLYHGKGPVLVKFKALPDTTDRDKFNRIYMNVDGEYFYIIKPLSIRIELNKEICGGSVPFLLGYKQEIKENQKEI